MQAIGTLTRMTTTLKLVYFKCFFLFLFSFTFQESPQLVDFKNIQQVVNTATNVIEEKFDEALNNFNKLEISSSENSSICLDSSSSAELVPEVNETIKEMFNNWKFVNLLNNSSTTNQLSDESNCVSSFEPYYLNVMNKSLFIVNEEKPVRMNLEDFKETMLEDDK